MNKKLYIAIIIIFVVGLIIFGLRFLSGEDNWICQNGQWIKHGNPSAPMPTSDCRNNGQPSPNQQEIIITSPKHDQVISSPLKIEGNAKGSWFFEAAFPVNLLDGNGKQIAVRQAHAEGEWMTEGFVPFSATLDFSAPETDNGVLLFKNDNPSGLPGKNKEFRLPVRFKQ